MKLDRTRPYGEVFGDGTHGRYEQDGHMFDASGDLVTKRVEHPAASAPDLVEQADDRPADPAPVVRKVRGSRKAEA